MKIKAPNKLCIVIGGHAGKSLSPIMHNAAYQVLGIDDEFVFIKIKVTPEDLEDSINAVKTFGVIGASCTIPHKQSVMQYLDEIDETANKIGAVNTILNKEGRLYGTNTDWIGVRDALKQKTDIKNKKAAVLGAGGTAAAAVYALKKENADVTIFNRTIEKAEELAKRFNCQADSLTKIDKIAENDIIINTTSIGMHPNENQSPINPEVLQPQHVVFDVVYIPHPTQLLNNATQIGAATISGLEMLLYQGMAQFKLYTGHDAPEEIMRKVLNISK